LALGALCRFAGARSARGAKGCGQLPLQTQASSVASSFRSPAANGRNRSCARRTYGPMATDSCPTGSSLETGGTPIGRGRECRKRLLTVLSWAWVLVVRANAASAGLKDTLANRPRRTRTQSRQPSRSGDQRPVSQAVDTDVCRILTTRAIVGNLAQERGLDRQPARWTVYVPVLKVGSFQVGPRVGP
jgi:hypothetical protein